MRRCEDLVEQIEKLQRGFNSVWAGLVLLVFSLASLLFLLPLFLAISIFWCFNAILLFSATLCQSLWLLFEADQLGNFRWKWFVFKWCEGIGCWVKWLQQRNLRKGLGERRDMVRRRFGISRYGEAGICTHLVWPSECSLRNVHSRTVAARVSPLCHCVPGLSCCCNMNDHKISQQTFLSNFSFLLRRAEAHKKQLVWLLRAWCCCTCRERSGCASWAVLWLLCPALSRKEVYRLPQLFTLCFF